MTRRDHAAMLNQKGLALKEEGKLDEAAACYEKAATTDPTWSVPLYNLGLVRKVQRNWEGSLQYSRQATCLDPTDQAAWWNLGIAATALRRWKQARKAWRGFGIEIPDGRGPIDFPCGYGPVRLHPHGGAEVVWAYRLDPARAELVSIPFPESGHRWRDIVLNDGAPTGYRKTSEGQALPVFDVLQMLRPSRFGTYVARAAVPDSIDERSLVKLAADRSGSAEDWTTSVRMLCKACSEGRPHVDHDEESKPPAGVHTIGIAARDRVHATEILQAWQEQTEYVEVQSLKVGLKPRRPRKT